MRNGRRAGVTVLFAALAAGPFAGCGKNSADAWADRPGPKVVASFPPVGCFAMNVAGDNAQVRTLMSTTGPHHFEPTDKDARVIRGADLFVVNGIGLDTAPAERLKAGSGNAALRLVDLGATLDKKCLLEGSCTHDHGAGHDHEHGDDPHVWLHPDHAATFTQGIAAALKEADPANAGQYDARAAAYVAALKKLKADGLDLFKDKPRAVKRMVTFHDSLAYFSEAFGLDVLGVIQANPGVEPNAKQMSKLVDLCKIGNVRVIAVEPQYSGNTSARAVLDELKRKGVEGVEMVEIDTLETARPGDLTPGWYEARMRANLQALAGAMK